MTDSLPINPLELLQRQLLQTVHLLGTATPQGTLHVEIVAPGTPGAMPFKLRRIDVNSVSVSGLQAVFSRHELVRYAQLSRAKAAAVQRAADGADAVPVAPAEDMGDDPLPEMDDRELQASADAVFVTSVLMNGLAEPTYAQIAHVIRGTAYETVLFKLLIHWDPNHARLGAGDPKA